jgi:Trk K+ transport system NAD-binding subunit
MPPPEIVLFGAHKLGLDFLPIFRKLDQPYIVVDFNPSAVSELQRRGIPVMYGDASENELLDEFNFNKMRLVVSTIPNFETNELLVRKLRKRNKIAVFIVIAQKTEDAIKLYESGADYVILPHHLGGSYAATLLDKFGLDSGHFGPERQKHLQQLQERLTSV